MTHRGFLWILPLGVFIWAFPELLKQAWNDAKKEKDRKVVCSGVAFV
jgi:hypothetical protein